MPIRAALQAKRLKLGPGTRVIFDGNSLVAGTGATAGVSDYPTQCAALAPISGSGATYINIGIGGQQWGGMTASNAANAQWQDGKINILVAQETTNTLGNVVGATVESVAILIKAYYASLRAVHPWLTVHNTTPPMGWSATVTDQSTRDAKNLMFRQLDALIMARPAEYGVDVVCDLQRAGSPFAFADYTPARWAATASLWDSGELASKGGVATHMTPAGYGVVASLVADTLKRLPRNPHQ
jgi:hypothetical protein